jgi:hypothetical protein
MSTRDPSWQRWGRTFLSYGVAVTSVLVALVITRLIETYFESFRMTCRSATGARMAAPSG